MDVKFNYIRECVEKGVVELRYMLSNEQLADMLTKGLTREILRGVVMSGSVSNRDTKRQINMTTQ